MPILYIGQLWEGGTARERMKVLNRLGHSTVPFDVTPFAGSVPRVLQSIACRFNAGPVVSRMNRALRREVGGLQGVTHIWVDKGVWIYPETLQHLKKVTGAQAIHYTLDSQIVSQRSRHFMSSIPLYDAVVTTKEWEVDAYKRAGATRVMLTYQGYDSRFFPRKVGGSELAAFGSDVCFVGHQQPHYAERLKAISSLNIGLRVWGDAWPRYAEKNPWARRIVGRGLWGESYPVALACAKIGLGLLGKHIPETSTTRTFEIPAMGTFLLAERTALHQQLFDEGKEADFFSSDEEMLDKTRFYLRHEDARNRIAAAGRARCERSGYSSRDLLKRILDTVQRPEPVR
ncbi:MAG: glycosyltransferase [Nitrospirae bacterium]|nr:glycosyltransferase [Nitrospirota bacterium]